MSAIKGGDDPHSRRRLMLALVAVQTSFCFLVLFVAGLFIGTFERLSNRPTGFSPERVLTLDTVTASPQPPVFWNQIAEHLSTVPGVERVAVASSALLAGWSWNNFISVNGAPHDEVLAYLMQGSPGWLEAMRIPLIAGRDFLPRDTYPGTAIVNRTFASTYFQGENPIGKSFNVAFPDGSQLRFEVVGLAGDVTYRNTREPILPQAYFPFQSTDKKGAMVPIGQGTFIVRTSSASPVSLTPILRREVTRARSEFRVSNIRTQIEIDQSHTVRERMLAKLALFFGVVALLLAGVGIYGVLDYSVLQRRKEIGIRMAIGAKPRQVVRHVTGEALSMVLVGAFAGVVLGTLSARYIQALLYQVKPTDPSMLASPVLIILAAVFAAMLPALTRALRIDPAMMLRDE